ncbi:Protein ASPARTIC PROTEASE IN GUARD CELL 1 [Acorus calamus]|uniref:Protein ASPARTIC PROTEASE IN GUARD CELL 1 n=1 Tax=Acorus calamus TaxID=4465 RepID=A0AAV9EHE2_ACOCL|nr:Protein ASPARTIC PROTEASE IN GUARD CELL 1 [Acorus calamus]
MARFLAEAESCINVITRNDNDDEEEMGSVPFTASLAADERFGLRFLAVHRNLSAEAYELLREVFKKGTRALPVTERLALFDTCYDLSGRESVEVSTVAFHFIGGKSLVLLAKNYLLLPYFVNRTSFMSPPISQGLSMERQAMDVKSSHK